MWRRVRIAILLLALAMVAWSSFYDRFSTTSWDSTLWVGVFPVAAGDDEATAAYIQRLTPARLADLEQFLNREARRYGVSVDRPFRIELYPQVSERPPVLAAGAGVFARMAWSLKLRLYARRASRVPGRAPPNIRIFVLLHDPATSPAVPHSVGLQKGLVGVVHAFADVDATRTNNIVIAHEILHTLGATDKYEATTNAPMYPIGYVDPERRPLFPQDYAEIMAGRYAVDEHTFEMPDSLDEVRVGAATALEVRWTLPP